MKEFHCPACNSNRVVKESLAKLVQEIYPNPIGSFDKGDLKERDEVMLLRFKCRQCGFSSEDISKFPIRDER
jgi:hypothetical protein